jgi:hypothetical protein
MKNIKILPITVLTISLLFCSCDDFFDVAYIEGTPTPEVVKESMLTPYVLTQFMAENFDQASGDYAYMSLQRSTASTATMGFYPSFLTSGGYWGYAGALKSAIQLKDISIKNGNPNYQGIAELIEAWGWATLADRYSEVPFKEAFSFPEIIQPKYDKSDVIYAHIESLLNSAIANLQNSNNNTKPGKDDLINQGDISKWLKYAYSLKARYALRIMYAPGKSITTQAQAALAAAKNGLQANSDNVDFDNFDADGQWAPSYERQYTSVYSYYPSVYMVDLLKTVSDPRLPVYFSPDYQGNYNGSITGQLRADADFPSQTNRTSFVFASMNTILMAATENKFVEAEANLYAGTLNDAQTAFEAGIKLNMRRYSAYITETQINEFIASLPKLPSDKEKATEMIITQKYIANYLETPEPQLDILRTGYPKLELNTNVIYSTTLYYPRRLFIPEFEQRANINAPKNQTGGMYEPNFRVWWDTHVITPW